MDLCDRSKLCDTHELSHQNIPLVFFLVENLYETLMVSRNFPYWHLSSYISVAMWGHTWVTPAFHRIQGNLDPWSMGWWLQLEVVGVVFVEVFLVLGLGSLLLPVLS